MSIHCILFLRVKELTPGERQAKRRPSNSKPGDNNGDVRLPTEEEPEEDEGESSQEDLPPKAGMSPANSDLQMLHRHLKKVRVYVCMYAHTCVIFMHSPSLSSNFLCTYIHTVQILVNLWSLKVLHCVRNSKTNLALETTYYIIHASTSTYYV